MSAILTDTSPTALARAAIASLLDVNRALVRSPAGEGHQSGGLFRFRSIVPHELYNGLNVETPPGPAARDEIAATLEHFRARGPRRIIAWLGPDADADSWVAPLEAQGFVTGSEIPAMAAEIAKVWRPRPRHNLEIVRVANRRDREQWARTFAAGYGFPLEWAPSFADLFGGMESAADDYQGYLAFENGVAVATSTLMLSSGVAGLYDVAVLPEARGRGIGAAITWAPYAEAESLGYRIAVLHASTLGRPMYERMGFEVLGPVEHFVWKEEDAR